MTNGILHETKIILVIALYVMFLLFHSLDTENNIFDISLFHNIIEET